MRIEGRRCKYYKDVHNYNTRRRNNFQKRSLIYSGGTELSESAKLFLKGQTIRLFRAFMQWCMQFIIFCYFCQSLSGEQYNAKVSLNK